MEAALLSDTSESSSQHPSQSQLQHHPHVPKVFALPDSTPEETDDDEESCCGETNATTNTTATVMIQLVRRGEGKDRMQLSNFVSSKNYNDNSKTKELSFHRPILVRDTPESIGMKIPTKPTPEPQSSSTSTSTSSLTEKSTAKSIASSSSPQKRKRRKKKSRNEPPSNSTSTPMEDSSTPQKRKRRRRKRSSNSGTNHDEATNTTTTATSVIPLSIRDVANIVGPLTPVQMINVLEQQLDLGLTDWTFHDLVEYFEDRQRIARNRNGMHQWPPKATLPEHRTPSPTLRRSSPRSPTSASPSSISPTTGRSRRQAAIKAEETLRNIMNEDLSAVGGASKKILNQISYEFSGTPLHSMVRSPAIVREVDWIDHAWPAERKPKHNQKSEPAKGSSSNNIKTLKKAHKGIKSVDYPLVQYYCLTSAAGSYTDFHIDFGGSSVWYHVVTGQKIFVVAPPTRPNLHVFEEWLSHADNLKLFLPDLLKEREGRENCGSSSSSTHQTPQSLNHALRFTLNAGETLILPAGWIHAVYSPVDSLVFGGNFLHGLDIQMQLTVNGIETRSKIADQLRFPHFGALHMYAGGMYLEKLRAMGKEKDTKRNNTNHKTGHSEAGVNDGNVQSEEEETIDINDEAKSPNSSTRISPQEFEELPVLINVLECWWALEPALADPCDARNIKKKNTTSASKSLDLVTWHSSFREAAFYVTKKSGYNTVQDFIAVLRNEYERVSNTPGTSSTLPVPMAIEELDRSQKNNIAAHKQEEKKTRIRKEASEMDDPLDVVLSKSVREYLASIQITTAAQLLLSNTAEVAKNLPEWRQQKGLPALKGRAGAAASVSVWKRKVRLRAAEVGATKLSQVNQGTNMKPLGIHDKDKNNDKNKESRETFPPPNGMIRKGSLVKGFFLLSEDGKL